MGSEPAPSALRSALLPLFAGLALLLLLEGGLRLVGIGALPATRASRLRYQHVELPLLRPATAADGTPVLRTEDPRLAYRVLPGERPPDSLRIFVLGGSAMAGLGFSPNVTLARQLERMLRLAHPQRRIEVVNLGIVAISSREVGGILEQVCRDHDPDLVVVCSGNNEFLEPHAIRYSALQSSWIDRAVAGLARTHVYRVISGLVHGEEGREDARGGVSREAMRVSEREIVSEIRMGPGEVKRVLDRYGANLREMADTAAAHGRPVLFLTVPSNWRWRGRQDLPEDWQEEWYGEPAQGVDPLDSWNRALLALDRAIAREAAGGPASQSSPPTPRLPDEPLHELYFRRAVVHDRLEQHQLARADYRSSLNTDPHLRRALDRMNDRVAAVARETDSGFLDLVAELAGDAEGGILGFDEFYDYVHYSPRGALLAAAAVFKRLPELGITPRPPDFELASYVEAELAAVEAARKDHLESGLWLGFCFDPRMLVDRDLWKYDRTLELLDEQLAREPDHFEARVFRGNARGFRPDLQAEALEDYRAALELRPDSAVLRENLRLLEASALR